MLEIVVAPVLEISSLHGDIEAFLAGRILGGLVMINALLGRNWAGKLNSLPYYQSELDE
jgi:hypothetical protein